jgi:hypothetical protein
MDSMSSMIESVRQLNVSAASGVWTLVENGSRSETTYFAKSIGGCWWSESDRRGVLLFDGHDWWEGKTRFDLNIVQIEGGASVHHDGLLQNMLSPATMDVWGDSSNLFNTHSPIEYTAVSSGLVQIDFAATVGTEGPFTMKVDLHLGCIVELKAADTTAEFASLVVGDPPDWIFLTDRQR